MTFELSTANEAHGLISSREAVELTGYTKQHVAQLCRTGVIKAQMVDGQWMISKESILAFAKDQLFQKGYVPVSEAAESAGYTKQHTAHLAREGFVESSKVGENLFIKKKSLDSFVVGQRARDEARARELAEARKREYHETLQSKTVAPTPTPVPTPSVFSPFSGVVKHGLALVLVAGLMASGMVAFASADYSPIKALRGMQEIGSSMPTRESVMRAVQNPGSLISRIPGFFALLVSPIEPTPPLLKSFRPKEEVAQTPPQQQPTTVVQNIGTQYVTNNFTMPVTEIGVSSDTLDEKISIAQNALRSELYESINRVASNSAGNYRAISLTNAIHQLSGVTISNSTFQGSSVNATSGQFTDISGSSANFGTLVANSLNLTGSITTPSLLSYGMVEAPRFTATSTTQASVFPRLITTYATSTNLTTTFLTATTSNIVNLGVTNATTTNATSTNLYTERANLGTLTAGTTTITGPLSVASLALTGALTGPYFTATSTDTDSVFPRFTATNSTTTNATSTNFFSTNARIQNASTTNISSTYASSTQGFFGSLSVGSLTGVLKATAGAIATGLVDLTSEVSGILSVAFGGTGWSNIEANTLLLGNGTNRLATTTAGTNGQILSLVNGVPSWVATTTFSNGLTYSNGNVTLDTSGDWTGTFDGQEGSYYLNATNLTNFGTPFYQFFSATTTDALTEGSTNLYFTNARARSAISSSATGLSYDSGTGVFSLTSGYTIPLTASTTAWNSFYNTPSSRITAGNGLSWAGNTLNAEVQSSDLHDAVTLAGENYLSLSGQQITANAVNLGTTNVTGTLPVARGGTGLTSYTQGDVLYASGTGTLAGTSTANLKATLALNNVENTALSTWAGTTNITTLGTISTGVWQGTPIGDAYITKTGDWTGTFDGQEGSYYLSRANHTGTQTASTISDFNSAVNTYIAASSTIPKTYTTNTFTGGNTFNGALTIGTLNGPLQANNGVVSATTSIGVLYGGTGATTASGARTNLGLVIGTDVQAQDAELQAIAGLTSAANQLPYFTGSGTASLTTLSSFGRTLIDDADATAARSTLGLGALAVLNDLSTFDTGDLSEGSNLYFTNARARSAISSSATGLSYDSGTGVFSLTSGYNIPLTASTTAWNSFYNTPSSRITAGNGLSWAGNTLNVATTSLASGFFQQGGNSFGAAAVLGTNDANNLQFETNNTARVTIDTSGNVGVGTVAPGRDFVLYRTGAPTFQLANSITGSAAADGGYLQQNGLNTYLVNQEVGSLIFGTSNATRMTISGAGNVGIGTTSPNRKLSIEGATPALSVFDSSSATDSFIFQAVGNTVRVGVDDLNDGSTQRYGFVMSDSGQVAIGGKTNPGNALDVLGTIDVRETDDGGSAVKLSAGSGSGSIQVYEGGVSKILLDPTSGVSYINNGNFGIGTTTPAAKLDVAGSIGVGLGSSAYVNSNRTGNILVGEDTSGSYVVAGTNATVPANLFIGRMNTDTIFQTNGGLERLRIASGGNVGIGDASPASLFTVGNGDLFQVNSSGAIAAATGITSSGTVTLSGLTANRLVTTTTGGQLTTSISSANVAASVTDETGTGSLVFSNSPTLVTPALGTPSALVLTNATGLPLTTGVTGTLPVANGGTGATSYGANRIPYINSGNTAFTSNANFVFDGTNVGIGTASPSARLDISGNDAAVNLASFGRSNNYTAGSGGETWLIGTVGAAFGFNDGYAIFEAYGASDYGPRGRADFSVRVSTRGGTVDAAWEGSSFGTPSDKAYIDVRDNGDGTAGVYLVAPDYVDMIVKVTSTFTYTHSAATATISGTSVLATNTDAPNLTRSFGNVGVGTSNPTAKLDIAGTHSSTDFRITRLGNPSAYLAMSAPGGANTQSTVTLQGVPVLGLEVGGGIGVGAYAGTDTNIPTNGLIVSGNVGIGTTSPYARLSVAGATTGSGYSLVTTSSNNTARFSVKDDGVIRWGANVSPGSLLYSGYLSWDTNKVIIGAESASTDVDVRAGGASRVYVQSTGNVGIGTTTPANRLDVYSSAAGLLRLERATGAGWLEFREGGTLKTYFGFESSGGSGIATGALGNATVLRSQNALHLISGSSATNGITVSTGGNVGIGTTSPAYKLDVWRNVASQGFVQRWVNPNTTAGATVALNLGVFNGNTGLIIEQSSNATGPAWASGSYDAFIRTGQSSSKLHLAGGNSSTPQLTIDASGNIGIGTTAPIVRLSLGAGTANHPSTKIAYYQFGADIYGHGLAYNGSIFGVGTYANVDASSGVPQMWVGSNGNVGIGTTSPGTKLDVQGSVRLQNGTQYTDIVPSLNDYELSFVGSDSKTRINMDWDRVALYANGSELFRVNQTGTGIATTSPWAQLSVEGQGSKPSFVVADSSNNTDFIITESGNVGIGTTTPEHQLDIAGNGGTGIGIGQKQRKKTITASTNSPYDILTLTSNGSTGSWRGAIDFNVSYNGGSAFNAVRVVANTDGTTANVGIGTTSPDVRLQVAAGNAGYTWTPNTRTNLIVEGSSSAGSAISIIGKSTGTSNLWFGDEAVENTGQLRYDHTTNTLYTYVGGGDRMTILSSGNVGIGTTNPQTKLDVLGTASSTNVRVASLTPGLPVAADSNRNLVSTSTISSAFIEGLSGTNTGDVTLAGSLDYLTISGQVITRNAIDLATDVTGTLPVANGGTGATTLTGLLQGNGTSAVTAVTGTAGQFPYYNGTNTLAATSTLFLATSGNVGIGTTNPSLGILNISGENNDKLRLIDTDGSDFRTLVTGGTYRIYDNQDAAYRLFIDTSGNIGLGTTGPGARLHVQTANGGVKGIFGSDDTGESFIQFTNASTGNTNADGLFVGINNGVEGANILVKESMPLRFSTSNVERVRITSTGNVGIGTTTPASGLVVQKGSGNYADFRLQSTHASSGGYYTIFKSDYADQSFSINVGGTNILKTYGYNDADSLSIGVKDYEDALHIDTSGNVGIGTTSPSQKLSVLGNSYITGGLGVGRSTSLNSSKVTIAQDTSSGQLTIAGAANSNQQLILGYNTSSNYSAISSVEQGVAYRNLVLNSNGGNVGIGDTSPAALFTVGNGDLFQVNSSGAIAAATGITSSGTITFSGLTANRLVTTTTGGQLTTSISSANVAASVTDETGTGSLVFSNSPTLVTPALGTPSALVLTNATGLPLTTGVTGTLPVANGGTGATSYGANRIPYINSGNTAFTSNANFVFNGSNLGVGIASPGAKLDVGLMSAFQTSGAIRLNRADGTARFHELIAYNDSSAAGNYLEFALHNGTLGATTSVMRLRGDGSVGIGTTTPSSKLTLTSASASDTLVSLFGSAVETGSDTFTTGLFKSGTTNGAPDVRIVDADNSSTRAALQIQGNGGATEVAFFGSNGNVGVGTVSPSSRLHIESGSNGTGTYNSTAEIQNTVDEAQLTLRGAASGYTNAAINLVATQGSDARGLGVYAHDEGSGRTWYWGRPYASSDMFVINRRATSGYSPDAADEVDADVSNFLTVRSTGYVGIGTASPSSIFHIDDNATSGTGLTVTGGGGGSPLATFTRDVGSTGTVTINSSGGDPQMSFDSGSNTFAVGVDGSSFKISDNTAVGTNDRFTIDSSGEVGIGTASPVGTLHVNNTTAYDGAETATGQDSIVLYGGDGTAAGTYNGGLTWYSGSRRRAGIASVKENVDSDYLGLAFFTQGTDGPGSMAESMRISHSGNVGIGTTSPESIEFPSAYAGLDANTRSLVIQGTNGGSGDTGIFLRRNDDATGLDLWQNSGNGDVFIDNRWDSTSGDIHFRTRTNGTAVDAVTIEGSGNVGIGTLTPDAKLEINGGSSDVLLHVQGGADTYDARLALTESDNYGLYLEYDGLANIGYIGMGNGVAPTGSWSKRIQMSRTGTEVAFMAGNVGIGDSSPAALFTVGNGDKFQVNAAGNTTAQTLTLGSNVVTSTTDIQLTDNANIASSQDLHFYIDSDANQSDRAFTFNTNAGVQSGQTELLRIQENGNVGIGDASPASLFTVGNGDLFQVNSSGAIAAATGITSSGTVTLSGLTANRLVTTTTGGQLTTSISSANVAASVTDETGSGSLVFSASPTFTGTVNTAAISASGALDVTGIISAQNSALLRRYTSGWTQQNHDVVYNGYVTSLGDYTYLKAAGNSTTNHGIAIVADNAFFVGNGDINTGPVTDSASNPITNGETWLKVDASGLTTSGTVTATTFSGSGASLTSLNASNLSSGTVPSARISGSYTGITGTGALNAGSITSGFGNIDIGASTFTTTGTVNGGVVDVSNRVETDEIRVNTGQQMVVNVGESASYATGQTAEILYVNAEGGLQINSSPDNWTSGWAGRNTATILNSSGNSSFPGTVTANTFSGSGASLTSINASNISSGTLADARLSSNVATLSGTQTFTGSKSFNNAIYVGTLAAQTGLISYDEGAGVNVAILTRSGGTWDDSFRVRSGQLQLYAAGSAATWNGTTFAATNFSGNGSALTALNASNLSSGTVPSARVTGSYTGITGLGTISASGVLTLTGGAVGASPTPQLSFSNYHDNSGNPSVSHINLYANTYGFGISGSTLNYISDRYHDFLDIGNLGNPIMRLDGDTGDVGIGTTAANARLNVVEGSGRQITANSWVDLSSAGGGSGLLGGNTYINSGTNAFTYSTTHASIGAVGFATNYPGWNQASVISSGTTSSTAGGTFTPTVIATFNYDGNVGIGINNPTAKFEVAGAIRGQASTGSGDVLYIGNDSKLVDINVANTTGLYGMQDATVGSLKLGSGGGTISGASGNIGIGDTSPAALLTVGNGDLFQVNSSGAIAATTGITTSGTITSTASAVMTTSGGTMPRIVLDSVSTGDSWTSQGAYISLGESGDLGSASTHLTYRGDGYGFVGAGTVTNGEPAGGFWRFYYNSASVYTDGTVEADGRIYADDGLHVRGDWVRVDGSNGIYFQTYGGGWQMSDTTWLRAYGGKGIYTTGQIRGDDGLYVDGSTYGINGSGVLVSASGATIGGSTAWHAGNDGAGSGLDADTVDGLQAWSFLKYDGIVNSATDWNTFGDETGELKFHEIHNGTSWTNGPGASAYSYGGVLNLSGAATDFQLYAPHTGSTNNGLWYRTGWNNSYYAWARIWDSANDGSGSGLDADLLDGYNLASTASGSTVALRDSAADIHVRLVRSNYAEQSSAPASTADIAFRNDASSDNYTRFMTGAAFVSWLQSFEGAGSGLDADLLDGISSASFLRSDAQDQMQVTAHTADSNTYTLELYSPDTGVASNELSIRFHQGNRYYYQLRARSGGLRFTSGNDGTFAPVFTGDLTTDTFLSVTSASNGSGNIRFSAANPYITASSYIVMPGGLYVSGGTFYAQNQMRARGGISNDSNTYLTIAGGTSGYTYFSGNVGIGTTAPGSKLVVSGSSTGTTLATSGTTDGSMMARFGAGNVGAGGYGLDLGVNNSNGAVSLQPRDWTNFATNANLLLNPNGGNVGIGTTGPSYGLDVSGSTGIRSTINSTSVVYPLTITNSNSGNNTTKEVGIRFRGFDTAGTPQDKEVAYIRAYPINSNWTEGGLSFWTRNSDSVVSRMTLSNTGVLTVNTVSASLSMTTATLTVTSPGLGSTDICRTAGGLIGDCTSLGEFKNNVTDLSLGLETLLQLRTREFDWTEEIGGGAHDLGFIAEEVEAVAPLLATYRFETDEDGNPIGTKQLTGVKYSQMTALLVKSVQEMHTLFTELSDTVAQLVETVGEFAVRIVSREVVASERLCVGSTCITEAELIELMAMKGGATSTPPSQQSSPATIELIVTGNNPAVIEVGSTYQDQGALASSTDQTLINLGVRVFYNNQETTNPTIDTAAAGEHTITYRVIDGGDNTLAEATRTVIVEDPAQPEPPIEEPAPEETPTEPAPEEVIEETPTETPEEVVAEPAPEEVVPEEVPVEEVSEENPETAA